MTTLKTICNRFVPTAGARTRLDVYDVILRASDENQGKIRGSVNDFLRKGRRTFLSGMIDQDSTVVDGIQHIEDLSDNSFMKVPTKDVIDDIIREFIGRTNNASLSVAACGVCAREANIRDLTPLSIDSIPNPHRLKPALPHPAHDIYSGMLLHPAGIPDSKTANLCIECFKALTADKIPMYALANDMWIGRVPHELSYLTLPERLLIAKYFPAAYIIKLYPKKKGARHWDKRQMYSGMKGNVSTYQLDQGQIASMIDGTIMPQPTKILAATLGITFVGPKNIPEKCFPDMFRIRRSRVQRALEWLKDNNPLFENIIISSERLAELPEDDIPYEIRVTAKHSTDIEKVHAEHEGYVPSQDGGDDEDVDQEDEGTSLHTHIYSSKTDSDQ